MNGLRNSGLEEGKDSSNSPTYLSKREFLTKSGKFALALVTGAIVLPTREAITAEARIGKPDEEIFDFSEYRKKVPLTEISGNIQSLKGELPILENIKKNKVYVSEDKQFAAVSIGKSPTFGVDRVQLFPAKDIPKDKIRNDGTISRATLIKAGNDAGESPVINWTIGRDNKGEYKKIGWSIITGIDENGKIVEYNLLQTSGPNYLGNQSEYFHVIGWKKNPDPDGEPSRLEICTVAEIVHWWEWGDTKYKSYPVAGVHFKLKNFVKKIAEFIEAKIKKTSDDSDDHASIEYR